MKPSQRVPPLKALRVFNVAGQHLSFKLAAEELHLTASAVSHQVKKLESFLGMPLFVRKTRALELTGPGRKYHEFLANMFARLETETHQLWAEYGRHIVRLCLPPFFASELFLPKLGEIKALMPDTDIRVMTQPSLMKVHPADADLSILLGMDEWPDLKTIPLFSRRMVAACAPALKDEFGISTYSDLDERTLIVHENRPKTWDIWAQALGIQPPKANKILRFDSMASVVQAASEGHGIAVVSWPLSRNWFDAGKLVPVFSDRVATKERFYLAHRPEEANRKEVKRLIDWIVREFKTDK